MRNLLVVEAMPRVTRTTTEKPDWRANNGPEARASCTLPICIVSGLRTGGFK